MIDWFVSKYPHAALTITNYIFACIRAKEGGMNREKTCRWVCWNRESGIRSVQVYPLQIGKIFTFSVLFKGTCLLAAKRLIRRQFSELVRYEDFALLQKPAQWIRNKQISFLTGRWHSIGSGIWGRVLRTYYLTFPGPGRMFIIPPNGAFKVKNTYIVLQLNLLILYSDRF